MSEEKRVIPKEKFRIVGKDLEKMESISRPHLTFAQEVWRRMKKNKAAYVSLILLSIYVLLAIFAPMFSQYGFDEQDPVTVPE